MRRLTDELRAYLIYMANVPEGVTVGFRQASELERLGMVRFVDCSDGDYFEFTESGRRAIEGGERS